MKKRDWSPTTGSIDRAGDCREFDSQHLGTEVGEEAPGEFASLEGEIDNADSVKRATRHGRIVERVRRSSDERPQVSAFDVVTRS